MTRWSFRRGGSGFGVISLVVVTALGCGGPREEPPATGAGAPASSAPAVARPAGKGGEDLAPPPSPAALGVPRESPEPVLSSPHGSVLAGKELGMVVTGRGAGGSARSLDILEQQVLSFLPQLQEVYEREREQDPGLMGSLDVSLTIEPGGGVSDLRFPLKRGSSEKLTATVFDRMRTWTFPPAEDQVQLRYTLLFVPPGIDQASILLWEKRLGSRAVMDRSRESPVTVAAMPAAEKKPSPVVSSRPKPMETVPAPVSGWYRVTSPALLHAAPRASSEVVARLRPGKRVRVVAVVAGEWLEVHSVSNRPPGFLRREDARPELDERARRP